MLVRIIVIPVPNIISQFCPPVAPELPMRRIVVSARPAQPSAPAENPSDMSWSTLQNPPRPSYPKEMLKHRFLPVGSETPTAGDKDRMEVDDVVPTPKSSLSKNKANGEAEESKTKKRKTEGSSKRSKKSKGAE
jgi:hypothetical protein